MSEPVTTPAAAKAADSPEELGLVSALKRLLTKHKDTQDDAQEHALGGKTREQKLMGVVDEAVTGAKGANPDY